MDDMDTGAAGLIVAVGDLVEDVVVWTAGTVQVGTDNAAQVHRTRGGSAANVAVAAAASGPARFVGRVGDDPLGERLVGELQAAGVQTCVQRAGRTGTIVVLVDADGERTMFPDRAAAAELADVPAGWVAGAGVVHASAYCLAAPASAATTLALLHAARLAGALTSIDVASVGLIEALGRETFTGLLGQARPDLLFANAEEARALGLGATSSGITSFGGTSFDATSFGGMTVVVKDGPRPVRVRGSGADVVVAVPPVAGVRDTTGAGDAFAAGYLRAVLGGASASTAARAGVDGARTVLTSPGGSPTPPRPPS